MEALAVDWGMLARLAWTSTAAAWAQALLTVAAVLIAAWIANGERRARQRELRQAARIVADRCQGVLHGLAAKEAGGAFSLGNIDASQDEVEATLRLLESLPLADLRWPDIQPYLGVHRQMTTARRRLRFIRDKLERGEPAGGVGQFADLLQAVRQAAGGLGRRPHRTPRDARNRR